MAEQKTPQQEFDPTAGMTRSELFLAGMGKAFVDMGRWVGNKVGLVSDEDIAEAKRLDAALMNTKAGQLGNSAGYVAVGVATAAPGLTAATVTGVAKAGLAVASRVGTRSAVATAAPIGAVATGAVTSGAGAGGATIATVAATTAATATATTSTSLAATAVNIAARTASAAKTAVTHPVATAGKVAAATGKGVATLAVPAVAITVVSGAAGEISGEANHKAPDKVSDAMHADNHMAGQGGTMAAIAVTTSVVGATLLGRYAGLATLGQRMLTQAGSLFNGGLTASRALGGAMIAGEGLSSAYIEDKLSREESTLTTGIDGVRTQWMSAQDRLLVGGPFQVLAAFTANAALDAFVTTPDQIKRKEESVLFAKDANFDDPAIREMGMRRMLEDHLDIQRNARAGQLTQDAYEGRMKDFNNKWSAVAQSISVVEERLAQQQAPATPAAAAPAAMPVSVPVVAPAVESRPPSPSQAFAAPAAPPVQTVNTSSLEQAVAPLTPSESGETPLQMTLNTHRTLPPSTSMG